MINSTIEETLENVGFICIETKGTSMQPMLVSGRDKVCIEKLKNKPKKHDVILYKRNDGTFILHRVKKAYKNSYAMWGDNHAYVEYGVTNEQIFGILVGYYKCEKYINIKKSFKYKLYKFFWCNSLIVRKVIFKLRRIFKKQK